MSNWRVHFTSREGETLTSEREIATFEDAVAYSSFVTNYPERHRLLNAEGQLVPASEVDFAVEPAYSEV